MSWSYRWRTRHVQDMWVRYKMTLLLVVDKVRSSAQERLEKPGKARQLPD